MRTPKRFKKRRKTLKESEEYLDALLNEKEDVSYIEIDNKTFNQPKWWKKLDEIFGIK